MIIIVISNIDFLHKIRISILHQNTSRSSRPEVSCKKVALKNFAKFTGKHLCQNLFFNKVGDFMPAAFLKESLQHRCFPVNFAKFLKNLFL